MREPRKTLTADVVRSARIPPEYASDTIEYIPSKLPHKEKIEDVRDSLDDYYDSGRGLILWGDHRSGKTSIVCCLLKSALVMRYSCLFVRHDELREFEIEKTETASGTRIQDRMYSVDFLAIDDVGMETGNEFDRKLLEKIIRRRLDKTKPTFITTNLRLKEFQKSIHSISAILNNRFRNIEVEGFDWSKVRDRDS